MIIATNEGLKVLHGINNYKSLLIDSSRIDDCIEYLINNNIKKISINYYQGYKINNLDFLLRIKDFIEGISISGDKFDYSILNRMNKLKTLQYSGDKNNTIHFSNFPDLETLSFDFYAKKKGLDTCKKLKSIVITDYKPKVKDFADLPEFENLKELFLFQTDIVSLKGIERFKNLKKLQIFKANKLESISDLKYLSSSLEEIEIDKCKKINDFESLGKIKSIKKLLILDSGNIKTLSFIEELKNIEFFSFGRTTVLDGNLSFCEGIKYVGFDNKKHYSHKFEYFLEKNKNRKQLVQRLKTQL